LIENATKNFEHFEAWLSSKNSGNEIFSSSNAIIMKVVFSEMQKMGFRGNEQKLLDRLFDLALAGARLFRDFAVYYLVEAFPITWEQQEEIEIDAPLISEVQLPLIVAG
jgi:hypothetical protein